ncbi:class I SAM-dependent methyltransferase [Nocardia wallacei]|uniref:class I SAM-dependent methyltransferase n=1 Tax=Nocardia wallacei TaxID=480035 RepID=UPI0024565E0E|nr:class I SAM-dependent methyltransferase [Nocardia wallacei]
MTSSGFAYTGCSNLEAMAEAVNYNKFLVDTVEEHITSPGLRVLDFGAGSGTYADLLAARHIVPECLEPDPTLRTALLSKGYRLVDETASAVPEQYEVIYTFNVLEHIENDRQASQRLASLLRPGGTLIVYVPALEVLFSAMDVKVGHYRRYRRAQLEQMLRTAGLAIAESRYCDPIGFFATLAYKVFGRGDGTINPAALKFYDRMVFPLSKALQSVTSGLFGKNVLIVATKP